jgi:hypothetical protein
MIKKCKIGFATNVFFLRPSIQKWLFLKNFLEKSGIYQKNTIKKCMQSKPPPLPPIKPAEIYYNTPFYPHFTYKPIFSWKISKKSIKKDKNSPLPNLQRTKNTYSVVRETLFVSFQQYTTYGVWIIWHQFVTSFLSFFCLRFDLKN